MKNQKSVANGRLSAFDVGNGSQLKSQPRGIAPKSANGISKTNGQRATSARMCARSAVASSQTPNENGRRGIVASGAKTPPRNDGNGQGEERTCNGSVPPLNEGSSVPPFRGYVDPPAVGNCKQCQRPLVRKSRNGRIPKFCNSNCRVKHHRQKKRETAVSPAGGGSNE